MSMIRMTGFAQSLAAYGGTLPKDAAAAIATWDAANNIKTGDVVTPLRLAAQTGDLTAKNIGAALLDAATTQAAGDRARQLVAELELPLSSRFAAVVQRDADTIVESLRPAFRQAVDWLTGAIAVVPADVDAADVLTSGGPGSAEAWQALHRAETILDAVAHLRGQLVSVFDYPHTGPTICAFIAPPASPQRFADAEHLWRGYRLRATGRMAMADKLSETPGGKWRRLLDAGHALNLNTADEAAAIAAVATPDPGPLVAA